MKFNRSFLLLAAFVLGLTACQDNENGGSVSSPDPFFIQEQLAYNLTNNPSITVPVARLSQDAAATVNVTTTGSNLFNVPSSVTFAAGDRIGNLEVTYNPTSLTFNETYELDITISGFNSIYGYEKLHVIIEYPTSYSSYGAGTIVEDWWGEMEDKEMFARDFAADFLQCYLPECWGHDSGGPEFYPVQDYVWYWDTATNKVYVPFQYMGCEDWMIADRGAVACKFGGPDYKEGSPEWRAYIDKWYKDNGFTQPYYDPAKKSFYLSDTAALSPSTGAVVYGTPGRFDVFTLE